jgi:hypothetical protein
MHLAADQRHAENGQCPLCALAEADRPDIDATPDDLVVAYVDDDAVVLLRPQLEGALVAPRRHVDGISTLTGHGLSNFLAVLRRTAETMRAVIGGSAPAIEPWPDSPRTDGHVCFRVAPSASPGPAPASAADVARRASRIRHSLIANR